MSQVKELSYNSETKEFEPYIGRKPRLSNSEILREFTLLQDKLEREAKEKSLFFFVDPRETLKRVLYG